MRFEGPFDPNRTQLKRPPTVEQQIRDSLRPMRPTTLPPIEEFFVEDKFSFWALRSILSPSFSHTFFTGYDLKINATNPADLELFDLSQDLRQFDISQILSGGAVGLGHFWRLISGQPQGEIGVLTTAIPSLPSGVRSLALSDRTGYRNIFPILDYDGKLQSVYCSWHSLAHIWRLDSEPFNPQKIWKAGSRVFVSHPVS